jgi:hypothetical protein
LPGLFKINLRKVPARKAGTLIRNPATGEMMKGAAKPASVRVKIRALSKLKGAAIAWSHAPARVRRGDQAGMGTKAPADTKHPENFPAKAGRPEK